MNYKFASTHSFLLYAFLMFLQFQVQAQPCRPGSLVYTTERRTFVQTCAGDGNPDVVRFASNVVGPYAFVITDAKGTILTSVSNGNNFDFEGAGAGLCRVYGVSLSQGGALRGDINGKPIRPTRLSDGCFFLSKNFILIDRNEAPDGGRVQMPNGQTVRYTCPGDGKPDVVRFDSVGAKGSRYRYIVTDDKNVILALPPGDMANLEGAGEGICRVWGVAFTGAFIAKPGQNAATAVLSSGCFDLSDNFIETIRFKPNGGRVQMPNGQTVRYTCPGDGKPDVVRFDSVGASRSKYAYIITDDKNMVLGLPPGDMANLEGAGEGLCRVWGVAYTGNLTVKVGDNAASVALSDDCFDLSDNFIETIRFKPNGGRITTNNNLTSIVTIAGDNRADTIRFVSTGVSRSMFRYVVTDSNNVILGLPPSNLVDFESAGVGVCRVWGLAFTGTFALRLGDDIDTKAASDDCFAFSSNFVKVDRRAPSPLVEPTELSSFSRSNQVIQSRLLPVPNPFRESLVLNLEWTGSNGPATIMVRDLTGKVISTFQSELYQGQNSIQVNSSNWPNGIFNLTLYNKTEAISTKIVKVNY